MPRQHRVRQGEDISSIARRYGFLPDTIWDDSANRSLRQLRTDPDLLFPGDIITIPDLRQKEVSGATEARHSFKRKGTPTLNVQLLDDYDQPRGNLAYRLYVNGRYLEGTTDGEGNISQPIPANASRAVIMIENEDNIDIALGSLDPANTIQGIKERLANLGFYRGAMNAQENTEFREALSAFQQRFELEQTGQLNDETRNRLVTEHGS